MWRPNKVVAGWHHCQQQQQQQKHLGEDTSIASGASHGRTITVHHWAGSLSAAVLLTVEWQLLTGSRWESMQEKEGV